MRMKRPLAAAVCALLCAAVLCGCGEGSAESGASASSKASKLPYGATIVEDYQTRRLPVRYDNRYLAEEAVDTVVSYYSAIQDNDLKLFEEIQFPLWHDYFLSGYLKGEYTDQQILRNTYDAMKEYAGGDFAYALIDITDSIPNDGFQASQNIVSMLDDLAKDQGKAEVSGDISAFYELTVTRYLAKKGAVKPGETDQALLNEKLFVFCHKGQWYIIYN